MYRVRELVKYLKLNDVLSHIHLAWIAPFKDNSHSGRLSQAKAYKVSPYIVNNVDFRHDEQTDQEHVSLCTLEHSLNDFYHELGQTPIADSGHQTTSD